MKNIRIFIGLVTATIILPSHAMASETYSAQATQEGYAQVLTVKSEPSAPTTKKQSSQDAQASRKAEVTIRRVVIKTAPRNNNMLYAGSKGRVIYTDNASAAAMPIYAPRDKAASMPNLFK
jgi:hypothetical protein